MYDPEHFSYNLHFNNMTLIDRVACHTHRDICWLLAKTVAIPIDYSLFDIYKGIKLQHQHCFTLYPRYVSVSQIVYFTSSSFRA